MANVIDETENGVILLAALGIGLLVFWIIGGFSFLKGLGTGDAGVLQSAKNAINGFPDGADPGTIPFFQQLQGLVESVRNFYDMVFGPNQDEVDQETYTQAEADQIDQFTANYKVDPTTLQTAVSGAVPAIQNWVGQVQSNPASLPFF